MKNIFLSLFILIFFLTSSLIYAVDFKTTTAFDDSFSYQANQNLWEGAIDILQRTEYYDMLVENDLFYLHYDYSPTIGINKNLFFGPFILLFNYSDVSSKGDDDDDVSIINNSTSGITETKTKIDSNIYRDINIGIGAYLFNTIGINYTLKWQQINTEKKYITTTSDRSNSKSWITQTEDYFKLSNDGIFNNILEFGCNLPDFIGKHKFILQVQYAFEEGDEEDNKTEQNFVYTVISGKKTSSIKNFIIGRDAGNSSANFIADQLSSTFFQLDGEDQLYLDALNTILEFNFGYASRNIDSDNKYVNEIENISYNTNNGIANNCTFVKDIVKYNKNNDYAVKIAFRCKTKFISINNMELGIYPKYTIEIKKSDYDIISSKEKIVKNDGNNDGDFTDVGTDTHTTTSYKGDIDNVSVKEMNHTINLPIGMEIMPLKFLTFRFGVNMSYSISSRAEQLTETQNYTEESVVNNLNTANNTTTKYANRIDTNTDNTVYYYFSTALSYGLGFKIAENFSLDFLGSTGGSQIDIEDYKLSLTYYF